MKKNKTFKNEIIENHQYTDVDRKIYQGYLESHGKPKTRREFMKSGLIPGACALAMPTLYDVLTKHNILHAANEACAAGGNNLIPIININLDGGAAMSGNLIPMAAGSTPNDPRYINDYSSTGHIRSGSQIELDIQRPFGDGSAPFSLQSGVANGIQSIPMANLANTAALGVLAESGDDRNSNEWGINGLVNRAGLVGSILPDLGQNVNFQAYYNPPSPLNVGSFADIEAAIGVGGALDVLSQAQKGRLLRTIENLSASQARRLASQAGGSTLSQLIEEATGLNTELLTSDDLGIDPTTNAAFQGVWQDANGNQVNATQAAIVFNVLNGTSGMGSINMGGYDYHGANNRAAQNARDLQAGEMAGRVLASAAVLGKPVCLTITSDGAVSSSNGTDFSSDSGQRGLAMMFFFHPTRRPTLTNSQVGGYGNTGEVDTSSSGASNLIGGNVPLATATMFANYMAFNGKLDQVESATGRLDELNRNYDELVVVADEEIS